jgi:hypothetical protein
MTELRKRPRDPAQRVTDRLWEIGDVVKAAEEWEEAF